MIRFVKWLWWHVSGQASAERTVEEFMRLFPGRCMICSMHRYGLQHGHCTGKVEPHECIERASA